eukprot:GHVH01011090.1.p1 GENE.GHVH01011090.1~~GHVH01011090.1.p1  ORF type:complete len:185 (+),score=14.93 GHVH01011090.1:258-812(+)
MGCIISKLGSAKAGKFVFCLPLNLGALTWAVLWSSVGGYSLFTLIAQALDDDVEHDTKYWLYEGMAGAKAILFLLTGILWFLSMVKPQGCLPTLVVIMCIGALFDAVLYWISCFTQMANDTFTDDMWPMFYTWTVLYSLLILGIWMMMTSIKSLKAVARVGGTGWERMSAEQLQTSKAGDHTKV